MTDEGQRAATALDQAAGEYPFDLMYEIEEMRDSYVARRTNLDVEETTARNQFATHYPHIERLLREAGRT